MKKLIGGLDLEYPDDGTVATIAFPQMNDIQKISFFRALLQNGGTFLDIGAHAGGIGLSVAAETNAQAVHLFEPNPAMADLVRKNIRANAGKFKAVPVLHEYAISDYDADEENLIVAADGTQDSRLKRRTKRSVGVLPNTYKEEERPLVSVAVRTLDTLLRSPPGAPLPRPIVAKVDAQGSDIAVLRGAPGLAIDYAIVELWPYGLLRTGESLGTTLDALHAYRGGMVFSSLSVHAVESWPVQFVAGLPWRDAAAGQFVDFFDLYLVR
jgi:FkbM family methyltransferase